MDENQANQGKCGETITIRSADDAWQLLQDIEAGREFASGLELRFEGWPVFEMRLHGKDWDSTVPTRVMDPLLDVQRDIYRALMLIRHGKANLRRLTEEDKSLLELIVRVSPGSSDYKAPLHVALTELAKQAIGKMESKDLARTVIGIALVFGGVEVNKAWVSARQAAVHTEQTVELSRQETERLKIFAQATRQAPVVMETQADHEATKSRLLKAAKLTDEIFLPGVQLRGYEAAELVQTERARSEDVEIHGIFRVLRNDVSDGISFQIKVARLEDGLILVAKVPVELGEGQKALIREAEWSLGKTLIELHVSASLLHGAIHNAVVYDVARPPEKP